MRNSHKHYALPFSRVPFFKLFANSINVQICLAVAGTMTTVSVNFGYGRHLDAIAKEDLDRMPTIANAAGFTSVLAAMWSKTSFALTLARISEGWIFRLTWIIIVSINLIMGSSAIMVWIDMDNDTKINYFIFTTGEYAKNRLSWLDLPRKFAHLDEDVSNGVDI